MLPLWLESLPKILIFIQTALKTSKLKNNKISLKEWGTKLQHSNFLKRLQFSSVQSLSHVRLFTTSWIAARQASLSITNSQSSLRLTSIASPIVVCVQIPETASVSFYHHFSLDGGHTTTQFRTEALNSFNHSDLISFPKRSPIKSRRWICSIKKKQTRIVQMKMCSQFY